MLKDDEVGWNLLAAETGVSLVAVRGFSVKFAVKVIQRRLRYVHTTIHHANHSTLLHCTIAHTRTQQLWTQTVRPTSCSAEHTYRCSTFATVSRVNHISYLYYFTCIKIFFHKKTTDHHQLISSHNNSNTTYRSNCLYKIYFTIY